MTPVKTNENYDELQNELCFEVDEEDRILGSLTKYAAHRILPSTGKTPLHRAFSVFLFSPDCSSLLIQQRSAKKITFPLLWANSCCSHPIIGLGEDSEDVVSGVVKAARRKLNHELGIPESLTEKKTFIHCSRIQYFANQDPWGEHEVDHILLLKADDEIFNSINPNLDEVTSHKFVHLSYLKDLDQNSLTPWFRLILKRDLIKSWIEEIKLFDDNPQEVGVQFLLSKFSNDPILNLNDQ